MMVVRLPSDLPAIGPATARACAAKELFLAAVPQPGQLPRDQQPAQRRAISKSQVLHVQLASGIHFPGPHGEAGLLLC